MLVGDNRQLITVSAQQGAPGVDFYVGERVAYDVDNWYATETSRVPVSGTRATIEAMADPHNCG